MSSLMPNNQGKILSIQEMWNITRKYDSAWGVDGYEVPRFYEDPLWQVKQREYAKQKKGQKPKFKPTKRGNFIDDMNRTLKGIPAPNHYDTTIKWKEAKPKSQSKPRPPPANKGTFLDDIQKEAKLRYMPGVGSYNLRKSEKEIEKEFKELGKKNRGRGMDRLNFLCELEYLSNLGPGPGNYNPRQIREKLHMNNMKPKDWIAKHQQINKKTAKSTFPDSGTYSPFPQAYQTFGKLFEINRGKSSKIKKDQQRLWGTSTRFQDIKKTKSKMNFIHPGPGHYDMIAYWQGKQEGLKKGGDQKKKKDWMKQIHKGVKINMYYDGSGTF